MADEQQVNEGRTAGTVQFSTDRHTDKFIRICFEMKSLATILAVLVIQIVHAVEEEGDVNVIIEQNVVQPDVDECLEKIYSCADNEICENMPGTYRCTCADGFEKVTGICKDIDECIEEPCNIHGVCVNSPGSFTCTCNEGFEKVEGICEDLDECIEMCDIHGVCVNSPGSFTCTCNEGFEEVEGICEDIDECKDNTTDLCGVNENEMCANNIGNYTCNCIEGYAKLYGTCVGCNIKIPVQYGENLCFVSTRAKYDDVVDYCSVIGGHILTSPGPDIVGLKQYVFGLGYEHAVWFDISYDEGNWVWANGDPITESIEDGENGCVTFHYQYEEFYAIMNCSDYTYFICQHD